MQRIDYKRDLLGFPISAQYHRAEFDIEVIPERQSPSSRESNNQLVLELWKNGLFTNTPPETAVMILESMNFDGKERMLERLKKLQYREDEENGLQSDEQTNQISQ